MVNRLDTKEEGFTLIELMTAVSIFLVIMTISMTSILGVFDAERKSSSLRAVMGNLNFAIEAMSKEVRFGRNYNCGSTGDLSIPRNCLPPAGGTQLNYLSSNDVDTSYRLSGQAIEKQVASGSWIDVTPPEVVITDLVYYVIGAGTSDAVQPKVLVKIRGYAGTGRSRSDFTLQTLMTQRALDI